MDRLKEVFRSVNSEDRSLLLEQQIQSYHELQNQAQRLLRSILAIIGLGIALFSALSFRIPQTRTSAAGGNLTFHNFFQNVAESHISIVALLLAIAGILFLEALVHLSSVLLQERPVPLLGRRNAPSVVKESEKSDVTDSTEPTEWIAENFERLAAMDFALKKSYWLLTFSIGTATFAVLFILVIVFHPNIWIYYLDLALLVGFFAFSVWTLIVPAARTGTKALNQEKESLREVYEWESRRAPHPLTLIVIIAIFLVGIFPYLFAYIQIISRLPF